MKKHLLFATIFAFIFTDSWSQIGFEEGYFIDESDKKVQCFIKKHGLEQESKPHGTIQDEIY